jgi:hypothetical protein
MVDPNDGYITITKAELYSLEEDRKFLRALQGGGVDNWEGYDTVTRELFEEKDDED